MKKKYMILSATSAIAARMMPLLALANGSTDGAAAGSASTSGSYCSSFTGTLQLGASNLSDLIKYFTCFLLKAIVPLLFAIALATFIYGVFDFIRASASGEETGEKKQFMIWGIVALAVMFSVWGLVSLLQNTFGIHNVIPSLPQ